METINFDCPLLKIGTDGIHWTIWNSFEGLQIFGGIGSGKTSGSGRFFAHKYLSAGYGGLVLTVKPDEKDDWIEYCQKANRLDDLIIVEPNGEHYFNFLDYESKHSRSKTYAENIVQVIKTVINASEEKDGTSNQGDQFWKSALDMLISNSVELCWLAHEKITVELVYNIARAASRKFYKDNNDDDFSLALKLARKNVKEKMAAWTAKQDIYEMSKMTPEEYEIYLRDNMPEARALMFIDQFFTETYAELSEKTKSIIDFSFTGFLYRLLKEPIYSLFCNRPSTFTPDDCFNGKIIIINLPVKLYYKVGRDIQIMFKYIWQRAMERRDVKKQGRPVFLWADEAQNFLHEYDADYQATARSSRIATVYITQNIPNYYANMKGDVGEYKVKSFLGTLATKVFHANADIETNNYASDLIGEAYQRKEQESSCVTDGKTTVTTTLDTELVKIVRPEKFHTLKTGGTKYDKKVTGYIHVQGMRLRDGFSYDGIQFDQDTDYTKTINL